MTEADCIEWIRSAIGDTNGELEPEVQSIAPWSPEAGLSDDFRRGRVFLAGDAAHTLYPTGGLGMNLGYHGVHNLVWKLALVLRGALPASVLDSYEDERRPQADRTRRASVENAGLAGDLYRAYATKGDIEAAGFNLRQYGNFEGLVLGGEYRSALCTAEAEPAPPVDNELIDFVPLVRTGRRAPHVWLDEAQTESVLDHFGSQYVLLMAAPHDEANAAVERLQASGLPMVALKLPNRADVTDLYRADELVLVRPDGVIAARLNPTLGDFAVALAAATAQP